MKKNFFPILTSGLLSVSSVWGQEYPNIIVFLVDDMGVMDTSVPFLTDSLGRAVSYPLNEWYRTPNMERLSNQGIRFSNFYAQSVSSPSRVSIMTGMNAARHHTTNWINAESNNRCPYGPFDWNWKGISKDMHTYPKVLQAAGYRTIHVGKAHLGCNGSDGADPKNIGFDINIGGSTIGHPGSYYGEHGYGWIKGNRARAVPGLEKYHGSNTFLTEALTLEAMEQIEKAVAAHQPFYLNMAHYAVHAPFEVDKRFAKHYSSEGKGNSAVAFATLIEGMDKSLGDIMDKLLSLGVAENTFILFLGDNGGDAPIAGIDEHGSCFPLRGKKGSEYEGGVRVPFIAAWASTDEENEFQKRYPIAEGVIQTQMATVMDIFPTVLSVAGLKEPRGCDTDGSDLKRLCTGKSDRWHRDDFLMHFPHSHRGSYFTSYRKGDWKIIYYYHPKTPRNPQMKLFNLKDDPFEYRDLASSRPDVLKALFEDMVQELEKENACYPINKGKQSLKPFWLEKDTSSDKCQ